MTKMFQSKLTSLILERSDECMCRLRSMMVGITLSFDLKLALVSRFELPLLFSSLFLPAMVSLVYK